MSLKLKLHLKLQLSYQTCHLTLMSLKLKPQKETELWKFKIHNSKKWHNHLITPKSDMITVDLKTQGTQLNPNPKPNPMPKKTRTPRYKFKRIKKGGKVQKIQSPGVHKMKPKPSHRNKRTYWSKQLCYVNNVSHDSSSSALQNFCHMVTSNINGLHTVIYPQNRWLLKKQRVKIK